MAKDKNKMPKAYVDLHSLDEDRRIDIIGQTVIHQKKTVACCVDDEPGKPERYIRKLKAKFPTIIILEQVKGPVKGVITIRLGPPNEG